MMGKYSLALFVSLIFSQEILCQSQVNFDFGLDEITRQQFIELVQKDRRYKYLLLMDSFDGEYWNYKSIAQDDRDINAMISTTLKFKDQVLDVIIKNITFVELRFKEQSVKKYLEKYSSFSFKENVVMAGILVNRAWLDNRNQLHLFVSDYENNDFFELIRRDEGFYDSF